MRVRAYRNDRTPEGCGDYFGQQRSMTARLLSSTEKLCDQYLVIGSDVYADSFVFKHRAQNIVTMPDAVHPAFDCRLRDVLGGVPFISRLVAIEDHAVVEIILEYVFGQAFGYVLT